MNNLLLIFMIIKEIFKLIKVIFSYTQLILYYLLFVIIEIRHFFEDKYNYHFIKILFAFFLIILSFKYSFKFVNQKNKNIVKNYVKIPLIKDTEICEICENYNKQHLIYGLKNLN